MLKTILARLQRHLGEHQSHNGRRSCRACHAGRDVPVNETGSHERNKETRCSKWRKDQRLEKTIPVKSVEGVRRCIKFRSANVVKPLISMRKVVQARNVVVLDEKIPHSRNNRDGTVINLDVNNGVYTMDMWVCLDETGPVFSWQGQCAARVSQTNL